MKNITAVALLAVCSWITSSTAAELPDCQLGRAPRIDSGGVTRPHASTTRLELDPAALKTGQEVSYARDEPVLNTDYKIVKVSNVLVASDDFVLKSSWVMNRDFKFTKGQTITIARELMMPDGSALPIYFPLRDRVLFLTQDGEFCNQAVMANGSSWNWAMGHLTRIPDDAKMEWHNSESETASGRLRVIYTGANAGAMHFQEVWVKGSQITSSADRQFDQFADTIEIAGLKFHVAQAKSDSVRLSYAFGSSVELRTNGANTNPSVR